MISNLKGQYKNSYLGFAWQFLTPAIAVLLFYVLFTSIRAVDMEDYWIYLCAGMFPFSFLTISINTGGNTFTSNSGMIKKIYFPRELFVLSKTIGGFITFLISYAIVIVLVLLSDHDVGIVPMLWLIPLSILSFLFAYGVDLMISSIVVYVRDLSYLITAIARIIFWGTPIFYSVDSLTGFLTWAIWINPLTFFVTAFQDCLYGCTSPEFWTLIALIIMTAFVVVAGTLVFRKLDRGFAERL